MQNKRVMLAATLMAIAVSLPTYSGSQAELDQVATLLDQGKLKSALRRIDSHIGKAPGDARGHFLKARALEQAGRRKQAAEIYRQMVDKFPGLPEPYVNLAVLAAQKKDYTQARELLNNALQVSPSCQAAYTNLSQLHATLATQAYQSALSVTARIQPPALTSVAALARGVAPGVNQGTNLNGTAVAIVTPRQTEPETVASVDGDAGADAVKQRVRSWADAWSRRDVDSYLSHYAADFQPGEIDRATWAKQRRARLKGKEFIKVDARELQVVADGDRAVATFQQTYVSDTFKDIVYKSLVMVKTAAGWQIAREISE